MAEKRDGVGDGWILYEAWCKRNGGTPIRGATSADHICFKGPLPDDTIDPGDPGAVDVAVTGNGAPFEKERLELELRVAQLQLDQARFDYEVTAEQVRRALGKVKGK